MVTEFEKQMGERIRELRESQRFSREYLSEKANISAKFLYEIEAGRKGMSAKTLYDLSHALNVTSEYLLTGKSADRVGDNILSMINSLSLEEKKKIETLLRSIINLIS